MAGEYLIWSHEHRAWWGPGRSGYTPRLSQAGRYSHAEALRLCAEAMPGTSTDMGALPELPVLEADVLAMVEHYDTQFPTRRPERWR
jgi:hypothetical protein